MAGSARGHATHADWEEFMNADAIRERLGKWFREKAKLQSVQPRSARGSFDQPCYVMTEGTGPVRLTVDEHHEMDADAFVLDRVLGSVGVIHCLDAELQETSVKVSDWIEKAAYLRHLMGMHVDGLRTTGQARKEGEFVPSVELVLVVSSEAIEVLKELRRTLREFKAKSTLLHAIGINMVVMPESDEAAADSAIQRGFAWLLKETRVWFQQQAVAGSANGGSLADWLSLEVTNFRVGGTRRWKRFRGPDGTTAGRLPLLHVLHGPNGSGKSSLAEAFEFAVNGWSTRLRTTDLTPLIYRGAGQKDGAAEAVVKVVDGEGKAVVEKSTARGSQVGEVGDRDPEASGAALRFDEGVCDRLIGKDQKARMAYWLETYFPRHKKNWQAGATARRRRLRALESLGVLNESGGNSQSLEHWVKMEGFEFTRLVQGFLGLPTVWNLVVGEADEALRPGSSEAKDIKRAMVSNLIAGAELVQRAEPWLGTELEDLLMKLGWATFKGVPRSVVSRAEYERNYRNWLDQVARADLLESARRMSRTLLGWSPAKSDILLRFNAPVELRDIDEARREAVGKRDDLRAWLASHSRDGREKIRRALRSSDGGEFPDPGPLLRAVESGMFEGLLSVGAAVPLRRVFEQRQAADIEGFQVGFEPNWTKPLLERCAMLATMRDWMIVRQWKPGGDPRAWVSELTGHVDSLIAAVGDVNRIQEEDAATLQSMANTLRPALMELVELLTPASWAYQRLDVEMDLKQDDPAAANFGLKARGMELADVLNTAELNTVALAMHLLCAPLADNSHKVLFLDDPLQNMDELTVTTVARALAKYLRLLGQTGRGDLDFVLLLHAADDCERMIQEVPAAFYRIPWSSPTGTETGSAGADDGLDVAQDGSVGSVDGKLFDFVGFMGLGTK